MVQHTKAITMEQEKLPATRDQFGRWLKGGATGLEKRYKSPEALLEVAEEYLARMEKEKRPATMSGLALALGFRSRAALHNYKGTPGYEPFHEALSYIKLRLEQGMEERMLDPNTKNIAGIIFNAKNNYGYADKQEISMDSRQLSLTGFHLINPNEDGRQD